uniref:Protein PHLOEM PROTEIN 2-LIKE A9-like n=1 Tax=Davidia involucrata TaxID=16924 RepID=A0A5B6ZYK4_DAVIN
MASGSGSTTQNAEVERKEIKPEKLQIVWSNDSRFWRMPPADNTESNLPAELLQVRWLEIKGSTDIRTLKPGKKYKIGFRVSLTSDAFGWGADCPILIYANIGNGWNGRRVILDPTKRNEELDIPKNLIIDVPSNPSSDGKLQFQLYGIWGGWKGGLKIYHAFITEVEVKQ